MQLHTNPRYAAAVLLLVMFSALVLSMVPAAVSGDTVYYEIRTREETDYKKFFKDDSGSPVYYAFYKGTEYSLDAQEKPGGDDEYVWNFGDGSNTFNTTEKITYWIAGDPTTDKLQLTLTLRNSTEEKGSYVTEYEIFDMPVIIADLSDPDGNPLKMDQESGNYIIKPGDGVRIDLSRSTGFRLQEGEFDFKSAAGNVAPSNTDYYRVIDLTSQKYYIFTGYEKSGTYEISVRIKDQNGNKVNSKVATIEVEKDSGDGNGAIPGLSFLDADPMFLGIAIGIIVIIVIIGVLFSKGILYLPSGGGYDEDEDEEDEEEKEDEDYSGSKEDLARRLKEMALKEKETGGDAPVMAPMGLADGGAPNEYPIPDETPELPESGFESSGLGVKTLPVIPAPETIPAAGPPEIMEEISEMRTCPKCKGRIPVTSNKRPLVVTCNECGSSFTLKGEEKVVKKPVRKARKVVGPRTAGVRRAPVQGGAPTRPGRTGGETVKKCPNCGSSIIITSDVRPLKVRCDSCGKGFMLRDKSKAPRSAGRAGKTDIALCPHCGSPNPVSPHERSTTCNSCKKAFRI